MKMRNIILLCLSIIAHLSSYANLQYRHISMEDGLPSIAVRNIAQDKYGYMWFGTDNGLCRYDGIKVQPYRIAESNGNQYISANDVIRTPQGRESAIWRRAWGTPRDSRLTSPGISYPG